MGTHPNGRPDRTANPFAYYQRRDPYKVERIPEPPVKPQWGEPRK